MSDTAAVAAPAADVTTAAPAAPAAPAPAAPAAAPVPAPTTATIVETATPAPAATGATLAGGAAVPDKPIQPDAVDWRKQIAGDNADYYKQLERYASPADFGKAHRELQTKMSSGAKPDAAAPQSLPENASPEQLAEYRKANGIPDKAEDYKIELANGFTPPDADKDLIDFYKTMALQQNWTPAQLNGVLHVNYQARAAAAQMQAERDQQDVVAGHDALYSTYGNDTRRYLNALGTARDRMPKEVATAMFSARTADGRLLGNDPNFAKWLIQAEIDFQGDKALLPSGVGTTPQADSDEIARINNIMRTEPAKYWKDEALQKKYLDLTERQMKIGGRAA